MRLLSAIKSALSFPAWGGQGRYSGGIYDFLSWHGSQGYNYREAAGPLHQNGVVMTCAAWLMRAFPEAVLQVVGEDAKGEETEVVNHPLTEAFERPNDFYGADCLWQRVVFDWSIHGQAYIYKMRGSGGNIVSLWQVPQHRIIPQWDTSGKQFIDHYLFVLEQRNEKIPREDLIHFRFGGDYYHERNGMAPLGAGLREIGALNEGANYRGAILRNMGVPSHMLQGKDPARPITAEQAKALHALWEERVSGTSRGKPIIPNFALEAIKLGMSPNDLDLGAMNYENVDLICSLFGLSAMLVNLSSGSAHKTYNNYAEARTAGYETGLVPVWKQAGQELTLQAKDDYGLKDNERVEFCTDNVRALQEDQNAVWTRVVDAYQAEIIDRYRALQLIGLNPTDDDRGVYYQKAGGINAAGIAALPGQAPTNGNGAAGNGQKPGGLDLAGLTAGNGQ